MNPITGEIILNEDDIEFKEYTIQEEKNVYIVFHWFDNGERCGLAMPVNRNEFQNRNYWNVAYEIAKQLSRSFANYHNENNPMYFYITSATVDAIAKIIQNYEGADK